MDKQTSSSSLSSVRTFAKDMAKKKALTEVQSDPKIVTGKLGAAVTPKTVPKAEPQIYRAPSLSGNKNKSLPKPQPEEKVVKTPVIIESSPIIKEEPEQTLKPISAQKTEGETIIVESNARPGVIITDAKRNRFRLFPAIIESISQWFGEIKQKRIAKKTPKYTVPETSHRKGVIQRATSKTGKFASADALSIHERIRQRKERAVPKTPTTIWTANTEPGFPLLEAGESKISNVKVVLKKSFRNFPEVVPKEPVVPVPKPPVISTPAVAVTPIPKVPEIIKEIVEEPIIVAPVPIVSPVPAQPAPAPLAPVAPVATVVTTPVVEPMEVEDPVVETPTYVGQPVTKLKPTNLKEWLFSNNINTISIGVSLAVLALIIVGLSSYFWIKGKMPDPSLINSPEYQTLIEGPLQLIYPNNLTRAGLFEDVISSFKNTEGEATQQIFVASAKGETLLKPETVMNTMDFSIEPAFMKSVSYIYFGGLRKSVPFILLDISDYTTARGGMLNWETTIYEDLSPLLNYNQLYDNGSILTAIFTDAVINKTDVRILRTLSGSELLVYGLVNKNTVIITTNSTAFGEITNFLK